MTAFKICFCSLAIALPASAQGSAPASFTPPFFSIDQVMSAPFATHLSAAPQGARVVWLLNERGARNVWSAEAPDWRGHKLTQFDQDDGQEIDELSWAPDGRYLLFTRGGDFENNGDVPNPALSPEKPEQAIWSVAVSNSAPGKLTPRKLTQGHAPAVSPNGDLVAFLRAGQIFTMKPSGAEVKSVITDKAPSGLKWSPDGSKFAYVTDRGDHSLIGVYTPATNALRYLDASVDTDTAPVWSPDRTRIAYLRIAARSTPFGFGPERSGPPWSIRVTDLRTGSAQQVFRTKDGPGSVFHSIEADQQIFWSADDHLVFPWEQTGWCHLYSVPATGGTAVELTPGPGIAEHVAISHDAQTIFFSGNFAKVDALDIDRRHLWSVSPSGGEAPTMLTRGENIEWQPTPVADGSALAFLSSSYNEKAHAMLRNTEGRLKSLAPETIPAEFPSKLLVKPEPVLLTASDGLQIHGQLFLPRNTGQGRHPALVFFHGGSRRQMLLGFHYMYYYSNAYALDQYFANHGYVVLSVNYRSGIGYGLDFREAINYGARGASEFNDVMGAGLYLKSRADVDPRRIGAWGGSYGGYLTALALSRASDLFAAGVDFHGVHNWNLDIQNSVAAYDPKGQADAARIAFESSPLASVKTWKSPVLLIQGDDDRNVPFDEMVRLVEALREQHVTFEQLVFPNEIHDFLLHRHWVEAYKATADFFSRKLE